MHRPALFWTMPRSIRSARLLGLSLAALSLVGPARAYAQGGPDPPAGPSEPDGWRIGVGVGRSALVSFLVEREWGNRSIALSIGTVGFRDLSVTVGARQYFGPGAIRPYLGVGLWGAAGRTPEGPGRAVLVQLPVGLDWHAGGQHFFELDLSINRAIFIQAGGEEPREPVGNFVPLPGFAYRYRR